MNTFQMGVTLFKEGRYSEAVEKLHQVATAERNNHKAWNALGVALSKTGDIDQALICFENAISLDPHNSTYSKNLERAKAKQQSKPVIHIQTINLASQVQASQPDLHESAVEKSAVIEKTLLPAEENIVQPPAEQKKLATDFLNRALSLFGQASYHEMPDMMQESLSYVNKALDLDSTFFEAWQLKVSILSSLGRDNHQLLEEAVESCKKALQIQPGNAAMQFNKAGILESLGRYEEAVQSYDLAYDNSSNEPMRLGLILMKKGEVLEVLGKSMQAQQTYEKVAVTDRYFGEATEKIAEFMERQGNRESAVSSYRTAGLAFMKQNLFEKAYDSFNRLLAIQPGDEESLYQKGTAALALFEQKQSKELLEEALTAFDDALRIQPENITYLIQKGRCLLDLGRFEEGLQALDRALWINPSDGITLMNKGIALYQLSRHEEALKYFELVCSHHPEHAAPWIMKSRIHMDWKQYDLALTEIGKALEKTPQDPKAWEIRATILRAQGKDAEAQEAESHMSPEFF